MLVRIRVSDHADMWTAKWLLTYRINRRDQAKIIVSPVAYSVLLHRTWSACEEAYLCQRCVHGAVEELSSVCQPGYMESVGNATFL